MPKELRRLQALLERGLGETADVWPDVRVGYHWVHRTAHILRNQDQREALTVQRRLGHVRNGLQQGQGHLDANHSRGLQEPLFLRRQPVDSCR